MSGELQVLHQLPKVRGYDASVTQGLFEADVLEHVWDLDLRCHQVFGA